MVTEGMATTKYATEGGMSAQSAQAMLSTALRSLHLRKAQMAKRIKINAGDRYGRLVVVAEAEDRVHPSGHRQRMVVCDCDCGNRVTVQLGNIRSGGTVSCGCFLRELVSRPGRNIKHGHAGESDSRTYLAWISMKQRCLNPNNTQYRYYGGRGITVCQRWLDSFTAFLEDMGECPDGLEIERIDNEAGYFKDNCRWATRKEQMRNTRRTNRVAFNGETLCLTDWASRIGVHPDTVRGRLARGWPLELALTTPPQTRGYHLMRNRLSRGSCTLKTNLPIPGNTRI